MKAKICVSLIPKNVHEAIQLIDEAEISGADLIEIRLDKLHPSDNMGEVVESSKLPMIAANRNASAPLAEKIASTMNAAEKGFEYVDLELSTPDLNATVTKVKEMGAKCIVSHHEFERSLSSEQLEEILRRCNSGGGDIFKIITMAQRYEDNLILLNFLSKFGGKFDIVSFAMGDKGKISRLLSPVFGGFFTFASLNAGFETAPGQMSVKEMKTAYAVLGFE